MAKGRRKAGRGGAARWLLRLLALAVLVAIAFAGWLWWDMRDWHPDETLYPEQGALVPAAARGAVRFETLAALGARFVYLPLAPEGSSANAGFAESFRQARRSGLEVGVMLAFDPCAPADGQSALFARMVPRDPELLPPAIGLVRLADACDPAVSEAAVESELMTLVNQVEMHAGRPAILRLGRDFAVRHPTAAGLSRDLWLVRDRARPDYAGRHWLLWSANSARVTAAAEEPVEWVVVQK